MPKIAAREAQLRELLQKSGSGLANPAGNLSEADRVKADKLAEKIRTDYGRADEWGSQKEALSLRLWRSIHAHHKHLKEEMAKISPSVLNNYASTASIGTPQVPSLSALPAALAGLKSPAMELDSPLAGLKRKGSLLSPGVGTLTPGTPMSAAARARAGGRTTPGEGSPAPPERGLGSSIRGVGGGRKARGGSLSASGPGRSTLSQSTEFGSLPGLEGFEGEGGEGEEGEEKDDTPYCFCQRVSFGEMIGCDNAENDPDCKEWFHIGCMDRRGAAAFELAAQIPSSGGGLRIGRSGSFWGKCPRSCASIFKQEATCAHDDGTRKEMRLDRRPQSGRELLTYWPLGIAALVSRAPISALSCFPNRIRLVNGLC
ncbi:hypothetical protein L1887_58357 [Cichorium endivia]|nr:hypothetical protein L1887_58357 [Cichorium endivia]